MMLRRSLLVAGAPVASLLMLGGPAFAADAGDGATPPPVSFRVEAPTRTLLEAKTVVAPSSGSIRKGGAPAGACPADSAAGALKVATRGQWDGSYSSYGIEVNQIFGTKVDDTSSYWAFYVNNHYAAKGVCDTTLKPGEKLLFAVVSVNGPTPLPIALEAPKTVKAGKPFTVHTFVYPGQSNATTPVTASFTSTGPRGNENHGGLTTGQSTGGATTLTLSTPGTARIVATAPGEIKSAVKTITVTK